MKSIVLIFLSMSLSISSTYATTCQSTCAYRLCVIESVMRNFEDSKSARSDFVTACYNSGGSATFTYAPPNSSLWPDGQQNWVAGYCRIQEEPRENEIVYGYGANEFEARQNLRKACSSKRTNTLGIIPSDFDGRTVHPGDRYFCSDTTLGTIQCN